MPHDVKHEFSEEELDAIAKEHSQVTIQCDIKKNELKEISKEYREEIKDLEKRRNELAHKYLQGYEMRPDDNQISMDYTPVKFDKDAEITEVKLLEAPTEENNEILELMF